MLRAASGSSTKIGFIVLTILLLSATIIQAAAWNSDSDGNWSADTAKWTPNVPPNAQGAVADFSTIDITANRTVTLDASQTVGSLIFGDTDTGGVTPASWVIADPTGLNALTLDGGTGGPTPTITVNPMDAGQGATISAIISSGAGANGLTKLGNGMLTLSGANNYTGTTTLSAGTLNLNSATAFGASTNTFTINGGTTINNTSGSAKTVTVGAQNWNGDFTFTGSNDLNLGTGPVTLNANRQVTVNAGTLTIGGVISGASYSLTKAGAGTLNIGGVTEAYGNTFISGGTITSTIATPFATGSTVTLSGGGTFSTPNSYNYATVIPDGQSGTINTRNGGTGMAPASLSGTGTLTISTGSNKTVSLDGSAWSTFLGSLNFVNTTTTGSWIRLRPNGGGFSGFNSATKINVGANLTFMTLCNSGGNTITIGAMSGDVGSTWQGNSAGGTATYVVGGANTDTVFNGNITNGSATIGFVLQKVGNGKLTIAGSNGSAGTTTITSGILQIGNGGATGALGTGAVVNNSNLYFNRNNSLSVPNTITGAGVTTINGGNIYLNGSVANYITVNGGATLGGQGSISQLVTVNNSGIVEGGQAGAGRLLVDSLFYNGSGSANFTPSQSTPNTAPLQVTNAITTSGPGTVTINIQGLALNINTYKLITYGSMTNFNAFTLGTVPAPGAGSRSKNYSLVDAFPISGNKEIDLSVTGADNNITWTGLAGSAWDTTIRTPTKNWKFTNPLSGGATDFYPGDNVTFDNSGAIKTVDISTADVTPSGVFFTNTAGNDYTLTGTKGIGNGSYLQKSGNGKVTISSANTYTGGTTITDGTISFGSEGASGLAAPLGLVPTTVTTKNVVLNGGTLNTSATFTLDANRGVAVGPTSGAGSGTIDVDGSQEFTVAGIIANNGDPVGGYGTGSLNKTGLGTLTLSAANTYSGTTAISGGVLKLANLNALQNSTLNYNNQGGTLSFGSLVGVQSINTGTGSTTTTAVMLAGLTGAQDLALNNDGSGALVVAVGNNDVSSTYSGSLSGSGTLVKVGTGTFTINAGTNTCTTDMFINQGNLVIAGTAAINTNAAIRVSSFGVTTGGETTRSTITFRDSAVANLSALDIGWGTRNGGNFTIQDTANVAVYGNFDVNNQLTNASTSTNNLINLNGGTLSVVQFAKTQVGTDHSHLATINFNGTTLKQAAGSPTTSYLPAFFGLTAKVQAGGAKFDDLGNIMQIDQPLIHDAALGATADGGLHKIGTGTLILTGDNTYTGTTTVDAGMLQVGNLTATGLLGTGAVNLVDPSSVLMLYHLNGTYTMPNAIGGAGSLDQEGFGSTAIFTLPNTYTGSTTVGAGTLILTGSQSTSGVTVSGGALAGFGGGATVRSLTLSDSATLVPSDGTTNLATITVSNLNGLSNPGATIVAPGNLGALAYSVGDHVIVNYKTSGGAFAGCSLSLPSRVTGSLLDTAGVAPARSIILRVTAVKYPRWTGTINNGSGEGNWDIGSTQNWKEYSSVSTPTAYQEVPLPDFVYFDDTVGAGLTTVNLTTTLAPAQVYVDNTTKDFTFTGAGLITGSTALIKTGGGTLTISNTGGNNYTGGTKISGGTLAFDTSVLPATGAIIMDGGTLQWHNANVQDVSSLLSFVPGKTATFDTNNGVVNFASALNSGTSPLEIKTGMGSLTLNSTASAYTGNITVSAGTLHTGTGAGANTGLTGYLGNASVPGRTITVSSGATLQLRGNDVFGNQNNVGTLPTVVINGGTVDAIRYNQLGNVTLNGGDLTQSSTDSGNDYNGYQFRGTITVLGSLASTISSPIAKPDHLGANTIFDVADVTGDANPDLIVSTILRDQSRAYSPASPAPLAAGGLTKTGLGTMSLTVDATYTGNTTVNAGTLDVLNLNTPAATVTVTGSGSVLNASSINVNTLTLSSGATLNITAIPGGPTAGGMGSISAVPEPATWAMLLLAAMGLGIYRRRIR